MRERFLTALCDLSSAGRFDSGVCARIQYPELEGMCVSPIDLPAKWAAMIFGYFDESGESGDGFFVVAGFVGRLEDWKIYLKLWRKEMGARPSLHLADMRLGHANAQRRHGDLLHRLALVPAKANLIGFAGSVSTAPHADRIKGTIAQLGLSGYSIALTALVDAILQSRKLPKRERIEFTFEDVPQFAVPRAATFHDLRQSKEYKTCHGNSRIGKDSAMEKGPLLEASDYLAYAILQQLVDAESPQAKITARILEASKPIGHVEITKENVDFLIGDVYGEGAIPYMDRAKRAYILGKMKERYKIRTV